MDVELLIIAGCPHESEAAAVVQRALLDEGLADATVTTTVITTVGQAADRAFLGSPSFAVDGVDLFAEPGRAPGLACRIYRRGGASGGVPLHEDLRRALRRAAAQR